MKPVRVIILLIAMAIAFASMPSASGTTLEVPVTGAATSMSDAKEEVNRFLLKFDLPPELTDAHVDKALLRIGFDCSVFEEQTTLVRVFPVVEEWSTSMNVLDTCPQLFDSSGVMWVARKDDTADARIDILPIVNDWLRGRYPNHGIIIQPLADSSERLRVIAPVTNLGGAQAVVEFTFRSKRTGVPRTE
jgi:hypothetical protein